MKADSLKLKKMNEKSLNPIVKKENRRFSENKAMKKRNTVIGDEDYMKLAKLEGNQQGL